MSLRLGHNAVDWARGQHDNPYRDWTRDCLMFVRSCFNVASRYPSAETAYYNTSHRHTSWPPPRGVPVWWTNGGYGHVTISAGDGYCWSNDFVRTGRINKVRIASITAGWGQHYRGWTEDINGVRVWSPPAPKLPTLDASSIARAVRNGEKVYWGTKLKRAIAAEVGQGNLQLNHSALGGAFKDQYKLVQHKYLKETGQKATDSSADGIPGTGSLKWLGKKHGFNVKD